MTHQTSTETPTCPCCGARRVQALSPRLARVYIALVELMEPTGGLVAPTYAELADRIGSPSRGNVHGAVRELAARGWVRIVCGYRHRSITPLWPLPEEMRDG